MRTLFTTLLILTVAISSLSAGTALISFPGAEGYGKYATGGRGGIVREVTSLADAGTGTLRWALETTSTVPVTIVFKISGTIVLESQVSVGIDNFTIAGQTAPGEGITIRKYNIKFSARKNFIVRYIRFRVGDESKVNLSAVSSENAQNFIFDHCSLTWSVEENHTCYDNKYTTVQWCIIGEGLYNSYHLKGERAYGTQWGGQYASYHHNLLINNASRSPRINGCQSNDTVSLVDFRNNVVVNWGKSNAIYGGEWEYSDGNTAALVSGAGCLTNFVNNYYKPGPATSSTHNFASPSYIRSGYTAAGYGKWHISGNYMVGETAKSARNWLAVDLSSVGADSLNVASDTAFTTGFNNSRYSLYGKMRTQTAAEAYQAVLDSCGVLLPARDRIDMRMIGQAKGDSAFKDTRTYGHGIIDSPTEVGGWPYLVKYTAPVDSDHDGMPDAWETANGLNPNSADDRNTVSTSGYTNLERYLNSIVSQTGTQVKITAIKLKDTAVFYIKPTDATMSAYTYRYVGIARTVEPANASDTTFYWKVRSEDAAVAAVDSLTGRVTIMKPGSAVITCYSMDGSGVKGTITIYTIGVGTKEIKGGSIKIYPNPAQDNVVVETPAASQVEIYDLPGKLVLTKDIQRYSNIDLSSLKVGIYIMKIKTGDIVTTERLIKK